MVIPVKYVRIKESMPDPSISMPNLLINIPDSEIRIKIGDLKENWKVGDYIVVDKNEQAHIFSKDLFETIFEKELQEERYEKMENLIKSLGKTVSSYQYLESGYWEIGTHFYDNANDGIIVYAILNENDDIIIDDDHGVISCIPWNDNIFDNETIQRIIKGTPGMKCINKLLEMKTDEEDFVVRFCSYISAILQILGAAQAEFDKGDR